MTAENATRTFGAHVYSLGVIALGVVGLIAGDFVLGQSVPKHFPERTALAYLAAVFLIVAGAAVPWRRTAAWGAGALALYYALVVVVLMNGRLVFAHHAEFGTYSGVAEQLAIAAGACLVYAARAAISETLAARFQQGGRLTFGVCSLLFGGAHFVYMNLTAPLVPKWLPGTPVFWAEATGLGFVAAGIALLTGVQARLAMILLTAMLISFALLVHWPLLFADASNRMNWTEAATNLVIIGVAWVAADSLARPRP